KPWTKTTGCNPEALARSICCCSVSVSDGVMGYCALSFQDVSSECARTMPSDSAIAPLVQRPYNTRRSTLTCPYRDLPLQAPPATSPANPTHGRRCRDASWQQNDLANGGTAFDQLVGADHLTERKRPGDGELQRSTGHRVQYLACESGERARFQHVVGSNDRR